MKEQLIADIEQAMLKTIDNAQLEHLHRVLEQTLQKYSVAAVSEQDWAEPDYIELFLSAKRIILSFPAIRYDNTTGLQWISLPLIFKSHAISSRLVIIW